MSAECSPGVCSASFSFVFIYVYPASVKTKLKGVGISASHNAKGFFYGLFGFFIVYFPVYVLYKGSIEVIHMKLVNAKQTFSEGNIAVHKRQSLMYCIYKITVYGNGDVVIFKGHFHGG